jgi:hypothetical protein
MRGRTVWSRNQRKTGPAHEEVYAQTRLRNPAAGNAAWESRGWDCAANEDQPIAMQNSPRRKLANQLAMARCLQVLVPRRTGVVHSNHGFVEKAERLR